MDCRQLISLFNKCGGKLHVDYKSKKISFLNTNLTCTVKNINDTDELDFLLWNSIDTYNVTTTFGNDNYEKIHRNQEPNASTLIINTLKKN